MAGRRSNRPINKGRQTQILLECSGAQPAERNEMKLYCGCNSPDERRERACEDEGEEAKIKAAYFQAAFMVADDRTVEWSPAFLRDDWNSRTEQSERPKRDRLIALLLFNHKISYYNI